MDKSKFNDQKEWRKFGFGFSIILIVIGTIQILRGHSIGFYFYGFAIVVGMFALVFPVSIKPWMIFFTYLGRGIGWFTTRLVLCLVFYFLITPLVIVRRLFGKRSISLRPDPSLSTYWLHQDKEFKDKASFETQY